LKKSKKKYKNNSWGKVFLNTFLFLLACFLCGIIYLIVLSRDLPSLEELQRFNPEQVSKIMSADGKVISQLYIHKRDVVKISKIPRHLRNALLSMEDRKFYTHSGMSFQSIFRAIIIDIATMSTRQGASTITQQLARNMYNTIGFKKTITRKLKELITALNIEQAYTKSEIMELYLNSVYFGHGTYGVEAASKHYFGKNVANINLDECAILIGLLPAPARYSPIRHPQRSLFRRNLVLRVMRDQGYISDAEYTLTSDKELPVRIASEDESIAPYFSEYIRRQLELIDEDLGINLYKDGLVIHTTLDSRVQRALEKSFNMGMDRNQSILNQEMITNKTKFKKAYGNSTFPEDSLFSILSDGGVIPSSLRNQFLVQGAAVVLDPVHGGILGLVGGRQEDEYRDQFNRAIQAKRQPGSVFKPMIYLTALEKGHMATTQLLNQPLVFFIDDTIKWNPQNHDGSTGLLTTLRDGLRRSLNLISVRVVQELIQPRDVVKNAKLFGLTTPIRGVDAIALGVSEVYPLEITAAYSALANNGIYTKPISITRIEDRHGQVIKEFISDSREIKDEAVVYLLRDMMRSVVDGGTGGSLRWKYKFYAPAAGKTGTTNSKADAWFVGYTPQLTLGVWVGMDDPAVSLGEKQYGSSAALPIFARAIRDIYKNGNFAYLNESVQFDDSAEWRRPSGIIDVEICAETYDKATPTCPLSKEIYLKDYRPRQSCQKHENPFSRFKKN
jgi:penicillin-binding protein 1A